MFGNGHLERRIAYKEVQKAFAPPSDPHESYLIKGAQLEKIGRTKEFGYLCTCWRGKGESCESCVRSKKEFLAKEKAQWKPSTRVAAISSKAEFWCNDHLKQKQSNSLWVAWEKLRAFHGAGRRLKAFLS